MNAPMRSRFWPLFLVAVLVLVGAAWLMSRKSGSSEAQAEQWLPGLRQDLDQVNAIRITGAGNKRLVTLERDGSGFVVVERGRYPADTATLRTLLLQLSDARRVEAKTARAESHASLGVEAIASKTATGAQVEIEGLAKPLAITVGRNAEQLGGGTFVRSGTDPQSWLVNGRIVIEREPQRWLEKRIVDIAPSRIERIDVKRGDEAFALVRAAADRASANAIPNTEADPGAGSGTESAEAAGTASGANASDETWMMEGADAAEMAAPFAGASSAGALSELELVDVHARSDAKPPSTGATGLQFALRNGVTIAAVAWQKKGKTFVQLNAIPTAAAPQVESTVPGKPQSDDDAGAAADASIPEQAAVPDRAADPAHVAPAVTAFNRQWQAWTFELPPHRSAGFLPERAALLKSPEAP